MARTAKHNALAVGLARTLLQGLTLLGFAFASAAALAQVPTSVSVERSGDASRIVLEYDEALLYGDPTVDAQVEHTVLIARLSEAMRADISDLADELGDIAARARLDPDGRTLRIALREAAEMETSKSYNVLAIDILPSGNNPFQPVDSPRAQQERLEIARAAEIEARGPEAPPPADPLPVQYRVGQTTEYSRLEFLWPERVSYGLSQTGDQATVRFSQPADISIGRLAGSPPRFLDSVTSERIGDEWFLYLDLAEGVQARAWSEDGRIVIDLPDPDAVDAEALLAELAGLEAPDIADTETVETPDTAEATELAIAAQADIAPVERVGPDPVPSNGIVSVAAGSVKGDLRAEFTWEAPVGAAIFRRGQAIWIVFDASAELDLDELGFSQRGHVRSSQSVQGEHYSAARIIAPDSTQAEARPEGNSWVVVFSERIDAPPRPISVRRDARRGRNARLIMSLEGTTGVHWVDDPVVGDRIAVVTSTGPVQGLTSRREFIGGSLLSSAHGGAIEAQADDLDVTLIGGTIAIGRPDGLDLTPLNVASLGSAEAALLENISSPAFMDFDNWKGSGRFRDEWGPRQRRAAMEDGPDGRIALARFLLGHQLAEETLGMVQLAINIEPQLAADAHIRSLQGVASYLMDRPEEAVEYLSDPSLVLDPAADLWRGMVAIDLERWVEARRRLEAGRAAAYHYPGVWRARFEMAEARAALELGDYAATQAHLRAIDEHEPDYTTRLYAAYISARLIAANGDVYEGVRRLDELSFSGVGPLEARALYDMYRLQLDADLITRPEAIEHLENLRYRWRGDTIELDTVRTLGELYVEDGAFAQGLETMFTAQSRFPDTEAGRRIGEEMVNIFHQLFLEGAADRMDPIEAVALYYQYKDLAPIGTDGDRMLRRLADRLIAFDLLAPAGELLQHQVDYRLREPVARARIATDLAIVYLMDRRYEDATNLLRETRVAGLPQELVNERYLLQARAMVELGRHDQALELVEDNHTDAADRLRADVAWDLQDWPTAGRSLEVILGQRHQQRRALSDSEQSDLIRAAIAYSLSGDVVSAIRLGERYGEAMAVTEQAAAFEVLTANDAMPGDVRLADMTGRIASIDTLDAFMEPFRARFNSNNDGS